MPKPVGLIKLLTRSDLKRENMSYSEKFIYYLLGLGVLALFLLVWIVLDLVF